MSVVVWDGRTLAVDKASTNGQIQHCVDKAWVYKDVLLTGTGALGAILAMREWYKAGAIHEDFPEVQKGAYWCHFIVVDEYGLHRYEQTPIPVEHGRNPCAFGSGQDFAYGALAMGASAQQAVGIANQYSPDCGHGVDKFTLQES